MSDSISNTSNVPTNSGVTAPNYSNLSADQVGYNPISTINDTASVSNALYGANADAVSSGAGDMFDKVSDAVTKGIPLTIAAAANSFYNTGVEVANIFGADAQKATIADEFGADSSDTNYYNQHSGAIETAGLVAGSFVPGLAAVKGLKLAMAAGEVGEGISAGSGIFQGLKSIITGEARQSAVEAAAAEIDAGNSSIFGQLGAARAKAFLAGTAQQAVEGLVFTAASTAAMHASPLLDKQSLSDNIKELTEGTLTGGIGGALFEGIAGTTALYKATATGDLLGKAQEMVGSKGIGNITPGDRVMNLYNQYDAIPKTDLTKSQQLKLDFTTSETSKQILSNLISATPSGSDKALATDILGAVQGWKQSGMDNETLSGILGGLTDISPITTPLKQPIDPGVFYIPGSIDLSKNSNPGWLDIANKNIANTGTGARAFILNDTSLAPKIANASEIFDPRIIKGKTVSRYNSMTDAFNQGADIWIDKDGGIRVNPASSANVKEVPIPGENRILTKDEMAARTSGAGNIPLNTTPLKTRGLILNLKSGSLFSQLDNPIPVIGDFGAPKLYDGGIVAGQKVIPTKGIPFSSVTDPTEANARFVEARLKGIPSGASINEDDLPMLEEMHRQLAFNKELDFSDKGVTVSGDNFPEDAYSDPDALSEYIKNVKTDNIISQLGQNSDPAKAVTNGIDAIAMRNNVTSKFILSQLNNPAADIKDYMIPAEQHMNYNNVRVDYNINTLKNQEGNLLSGLQGVAYRSQLAASVASDTTAGFFSKMFGAAKAPDLQEALTIKSPISGASSLGPEGRGFLTSANAEYGTFGQQTERVGRTVVNTFQAMKDNIAGVLAPSLAKLREDPTASAEWGAFNAVRHSTGEDFVLLPDTVASKFNLQPNTAVLKNSVKYKNGMIVDWDKGYIPDGFVPGDQTGPQVRNSLKTYYSLSDKVANYEKASQSLNASRLAHWSNFYQAQGIEKDYDPNILYAPPINTSKLPFFAYVKQRDGMLLGNDNVGIMAANSADDLKNKISALPDHLIAVTKDQLATDHKILGNYQYDRNFAERTVNSELQRRGLLNNAMAPETRYENIATDAINWHYNQAKTLLNDHVELQNAEIFAQLRAMGSRFDTVNNSTFGQIAKNTANRNPYNEYIQQALGISAKDNYPLWTKANEVISQLGDSAFNAIRESMGALKQGIISPEEASKVAEQFGLGNPYGTTLSEMQRTYFGGLVNKLPNTNILNKFVQTANTALNATVIRLDTWQQLIHAVTLPIMTLMERGGIAEKLAKVASVNLPGTQTQIPGTLKLLYSAVKDFMDPETNKVQSALFQRTGVHPDLNAMYHELLSQATIPAGGFGESIAAQKMEKLIEIGSKYSGSNFTNNFIHFVASHVGMETGQAMGYDGQNLLDHIATFHNRVLGNYTASQRPVAFQGVLGSAVGLFQSYYQNLLQQVFRHIGEGNYKTLALAAGLQSSIFGLSSLPGFKMLNDAIGNLGSNTAHNDIYSGSNQFLGKDISSYLLYGSLSNVLNAGLYSRGDINPTRLANISLNPANFPAISSGIRFYQALAKMGAQISQGASVPVSMLLAAEHNGLSRPLSGLAQLVQGYSTEENGDLLQNIRGNDVGNSNLISMANFSRLLGARPLDEAVQLDALYRSAQYKATDQTRLESLGSTVMSNLYDNKAVSDEELANFASQYAADGGNIGSFGSQMLKWSSKANTSITNSVFRSLGSERNKTAQIVMGGTPLPGFGPKDYDGGAYTPFQNAQLDQQYSQQQPVAATQ